MAIFNSSYVSLPEGKQQTNDATNKNGDFIKRMSAGASRKLWLKCTVQSVQLEVSSTVPIQEVVASSTSIFERVLCMLPVGSARSTNLEALQHA